MGHSYNVFYRVMYEWKNIYISSGAALEQTGVKWLQQHIELKHTYIYVYSTMEYKVVCYWEAVCENQSNKYVRVNYVLLSFPHCGIKIYF